MEQVNLTKKAVAGCYTLKITADGEFVTNGHWAARRSIFKQAPLLSSVEAIKAMFPRVDNVEEISRDRMEQVVPCYCDPVVYKRTGWIRFNNNGQEEACLFIADDLSQIWIARKTVELFKLDTVTGQSMNGKKASSLDSVMVGSRDEWQVIVMPVRLDYQEGLQ